MAAQSAVTGGQPNVYSLTNSVANFGGLLGPAFQDAARGAYGRRNSETDWATWTFSIDYMRQIGTQFPMGIDTNHVGDRVADRWTQFELLAQYLSGGTGCHQCHVTPVGCPQATFAGSSSQAAVTCYLNAVPGATITDFARHGLDSSNAFCGPFPCSVLGKLNVSGQPMQASFGGINPAVVSNIMYFSSGQSQYQALHLAYNTSIEFEP